MQIILHSGAIFEWTARNHAEPMTCHIAVAKYVIRYYIQI